MKHTLLTIILSTLIGTIFAQTKDKEITIDLWTSGEFYANSVYGLHSMKDGEHYTTINGKGEINKFSYAKPGENFELIVNTATLGIGRVVTYYFNTDETKILFLTNYTPIYRRSFTADYYLYDIAKKEVSALSENGAQQVASFSPDGKKVAFVRENNIFIRYIDEKKEVQVTFDGKHNDIINGIPDWVYEEEFGYNKAYTWMPNSNELAFVKFNESKVDMFGMPIYEGLAPQYKDNALYPDYYTFKYPKAGQDNSELSVHVYHLDTKKTVNCEIGNEKDIYIPRIRAIKGTDKLAIFRVNRLQNKVELLSTDTKTGKTSVFFTEKNKYYIEDAFYDNIVFFEDGKQFIVTSERDGWRHIYLHNIDNKKSFQITKGEWDVTDFYGYDAKSKKLYFAAAKTSPIQREVYSIKLNGKKFKQLTQAKGTNEAVFNSNYTYFINYFSNYKTPTLVTLHKNNGDLIATLEDNSELIKTVKEYGGVNKEFFTFKTSENIELNAFIVKPHDFDANKKYPVIITQYSGPASQTVKDNWSFGWNNILAQKGFIVIGVDPRGTGARGENFRKLTYLNLGKYETTDLIETAKYAQTLKYVDPKKVGVWGWSFGGFETLLCLTKGYETFAAGIAVAPVTNWRYYDNIYTERFMRKPQDNADGYDKNSPINFAKNLKAPLLIVHGTADDNVHLQNSKEFVEKLVQYGIQFRMFEYTNRNHSIYGGNTRNHLYTMMLNFWKEQLLDK